MMIDVIPMLTDNYSYLLTDPARGISLIIDPAESAEVPNAIKSRGSKLVWIINTHHHMDHVGGNEDLVKTTGAQVVCSKIDFNRVPHAKLGVDENTDFEFGSFKLKFMTVPGHTAGHMLVWSPVTKDLFTGDTLFGGGCGRLFEGSIPELFQSLQKIKNFPEDTRLWFGHEYTKKNLNFAQTIEPNNPDLTDRLKNLGPVSVPTLLSLELKTNLFLRARDFEELAKLRALRDRY